jgi:hypothetical protein
MEGKSMIVYDGYKALAANIFNQAISDYKKLLKMQKKENLDEEQKELIQRKIKEIERFFRSDWADNLAEFIGFSYKPETLIKKLRRETK